MAKPRQRRPPPRPDPGEQRAWPRCAGLACPCTAELLRLAARGMGLCAMHHSPGKGPLSWRHLPRDGTQCCCAHPSQELGLEFGFVCMMLSTHLLPKLPVSPTAQHAQGNKQAPLPKHEFLVPSPTIQLGFLIVWLNTGRQISGPPQCTTLSPWFLHSFPKSE